MVADLGEPTTSAQAPRRCLPGWLLHLVLIVTGVIVRGPRAAAAVLASRWLRRGVDQHPRRPGAGDRPLGDRGDGGRIGQVGWHGEASKPARPGQGYLGIYGYNRHK